MVSSKSFLAALAATLVSTAAAETSVPVVALDSANVTGIPSSSGNLSQFLGIPFAQPPIGNLRFNLPQAVESYNGSINATAYGLACPQQTLSAFDLSVLSEDEQETLAPIITSFGTVNASGEDCLSINVIRPANATFDDKLPVYASIYGGGFEIGGTELFDGSYIVERSIAIGQPIIYVNMNYRLSAFGFLASQEVKDAGVGNLGIHDQREGLRWIQKYISQFGGDASKVTIGGQSAGGISVALHMLINGGDTEGLFRGAFMQSGSVLPVGDILKGQQYYDSIVNQTGCASNEDTLQCLREAPYQDIVDAMNTTPDLFGYNSLELTFVPRTDGVLFPEDTQQLLVEGKVANVPFVSSNADDEGTLFALSVLSNVTTDDEFRAYLQDTLLEGVPDSDVDEILRLYPSNFTEGSPFDTGDENAVTPQYKRVSAFQGDAIFQAPRRLFLDVLSGKQDAWSYLWKRGKDSSILGTPHGSDVGTLYAGGAPDLADYLINFVNVLNPNGAEANSSDAEWPKYTTSDIKLMTFLDGDVPRNITLDDYRVPQIQKLQEVFLEHPY